MKTWTKRVAFTTGALALAAGFAGANVFAADDTTTTTSSSDDTLYFSFVATDPSASTATATPTPEDAAKATTDVRFTKTLVAPATSTITELPPMTYTFTFGDGAFYPYTSAGVATDADTKVTVPTIKSQDISFVYADLKDGTDGTSSATKQSMNVIADVAWEKPGKYVYTAKETAGTVKEDKVAPENDHVTYDDKSYTLTVWVTYGPDGKLTGTGGVTEPDPDDTTKTLKDTSSVVTPKDPSGGDPTKEVTTVETLGAGTFNFKNIYTVNKDKTPTEIVTGKEAPFWMSKMVEGKLADQNLDFDISVLITKTPLTADKYVMFIKDAKGTIKDAAGTEITPGTATTVKLKHGDVAYFASITMGEQITVTEADTDYTEGNTATLNKIATSGTVEAKGLFGPEENKVEYVNKLEGDVTPTGILMNNLPYLALIVAGTAGLGFYFINKRRHNA